MCTCAFRKPYKKGNLVVIMYTTASRFFLWGPCLIDIYTYCSALSKCHAVILRSPFCRVCQCIFVSVIHTEQNKLEGTERGRKLDMHKHCVQNPDINGTIHGSLVPLWKKEQVTQNPRSKKNLDGESFRSFPSSFKKE